MSRDRAAGDPMIEYRKVTDTAEISRAVRLILRVFTECVAPLFIQEGLECFRAYIYSGAIEESMETGRGSMICAYDGDVMAGVICILDRRHISNLYVDRAYQRKGIATELLIQALEDGIFPVSVNAAPTAYEFYKKMGFTFLGMEECQNGMVFTKAQLSFRDRLPEK